MLNLDTGRAGVVTYKLVPSDQPPPSIQGDTASEILLAHQQITESDKVNRAFERTLVGTVEKPSVANVTLLNRITGLPTQILYGNNPVIKDMLDFLERSPTAWQAVDVAGQKLKTNEFVELKEDETWDIKPGGKYFVTRNGSSLIAFILPTGKLVSATILGAHTDSPGLKLKPNPEIKSERCSLLSTQIYGGPVVPSWFNRMLGLAGRCSYKTAEGHLKELLVDIREPIANIPQVAIHLHRDLKLKVETNPQHEMRAVVAANLDLGSRSYIESLIEERYGVKPLPGFELFLVPLDKPIVWGPGQQFISSPRLDNLLGCHASITALLNSSQPSEDGTLKVIALWDNEEVGSLTKQGAEAPFLPDTLERVMKKSRLKKEERTIFLNKSYLVSNDVAHECHPNFAEKHDSNHKPHPGLGIVFKISAAQNYATDAMTQARFVKILQENGIPSQQFTVRSDSPCGTTIGPIVAARTGIKTVDIGELVLSMHSIIEQGSSPDHLIMVEGLTKILEKHIE